MQAKNYNPALLGKPVQAAIGIENADGIIAYASAKNVHVLPDGTVEYDIVCHKHTPIVVQVDTRQAMLKRFKRVCHALGIAKDALEDERLVAVKDDDGTIVPVRLKCGTFLCYGTPEALEELTRHPVVLKWDWVPKAVKVGRGQGQSPKK